MSNQAEEGPRPRVLVACPTWSGCQYALKAWADAYHAQTYPRELLGALQVDNSDGPQTGGNLHYRHSSDRQRLHVHRGNHPDWYWCSALDHAERHDGDPCQLRRLRQWRLSHFKVKEGVHTVAGGGITETINNAIPAGCLLLGVSFCVTTEIVMTTGVNWDAGIAGATTRFAENQVLTVGVNTTMANTAATTGPLYYQSATSIVLTADAGTWTSAAILYKLWYLDLTAVAS